VPRVVPEPKRWIDPDVLPLDATRVRRFTVTMGPARLALERRGDGRWDAGGRALAPAVVDPLLQALAGLVARDVLPDGTPSSGQRGSEPLLRVTFDEVEPDASDARPTPLAFALGWEDASGAEPLPDGDVRASRSDAEREWWLALPAASARRVEVLARRLLDAADG